MAQSNVPQFGKWETNGAIPYTQYFENARKGRIGGRMINPNDPQGNPEAFGGAILPVTVLPSKNETEFRASNDHSPFHPQYQTWTANNVSSPSKCSLDVSGTPDCSRMRNQGFGTSERASSVPKFGEWDESNPSCADAYSQIFNKVREEKQTGSTKATTITSDSIYINDKSGGNNASGCSCFGWFSKKYAS